MGSGCWWRLTCAPVATGGRRYTRNERLLNGIFYQARAGSAWHLLSHDLSPWRTVYKQFEAWRADGPWDRLMAGLRRAVHQPQRAAKPTAGAIDAQSVRTGAKRGLLRLRCRQVNSWP